MTLKHTVQVTILGQHYSVRSEADPEEVHRVADYVNRRIEETHAAIRTANTLDIVVLALLNVTGELLKLRKEGAVAIDGAGEERLRQLLARVEAACDEPMATS